MTYHTHEEATALFGRACRLKSANPELSGTHITSILKIDKVAAKFINQADNISPLTQSDIDTLYDLYIDYRRNATRKSRERMKRKQEAQRKKEISHLNYSPVASESAERTIDDTILSTKSKSPNLITMALKEILYEELEASIKSRQKK